MYVQKQIEKLLQHRDIKRASHSELKAACVDALNTLKAENVSAEKPSTPVPNGAPNEGSAGSVCGSDSPDSIGSRASAAWVLPEPNPSCVHVEKFFLPFELACQSKTPKIVCSALDSVEKLIAYGHISHEYFDNQQKEFMAAAAATNERFLILYISLKQMNPRINSPTPYICNYTYYKPFADNYFITKFHFPLNF